ncbi:MAG: formyltetrahydrofolate deformylase [Bacteroidota bacterium]|nr:formyltetrahydrofolate deformylase [Bacteroidota bacterium]
MEEIFTLLIDCSDEKGLIYKVTSVLYQSGCNIIRNDEYVSQEDVHFFMRSEFSGQSAMVHTVIAELKKVLPPDAHIRLSRKEKRNIVILVTKEHHCLSELLTRAHFNELNANILAVISNYDTLQNFTEKFNIPYQYVSHQDLSREAHEEKIVAAIKQYAPDYVVLAKYMRILTPAFVQEFENKIINIHHSFLPAFIGANPYRQAFERGVKIVGATAHFVNNQLDEGPIIAQSVIPVDHRQDAAEMALAGKDIEKYVLSNALRIVFDDKVFVNGNKTIVFD